MEQGEAVGRAGAQVPPGPFTAARSVGMHGSHTGIGNGKTVIPYFRFPGETTFAEGSARPVITDGSFTWQRTPGKKFYAYVTNDDGAVTSNRVIIPANWHNLGLGTSST